MSDLTLLHAPYLLSELSDVYPNEEPWEWISLYASPANLWTLSTTLVGNEAASITYTHKFLVKNTKPHCQHPPLIAYHLSRSPYCPQKSISRILSGQVPLRAEQVPLRAGPSQSRSLSGWVPLRAEQVPLRAGPSQSGSLSEQVPLSTHDRIKQVTRWQCRQ